MASYPGAVKTFTSKSNGETIQASHVTDLQDEVTAIEDGLLNGTAPINSSRITAPAAQITNCTITNLTATAFAFPANSTLTNVNVTGGSTLASLHVSGGSTLATLNVSGGSTLADLVVRTAAPCAVVTNNANINTATASTTRLTFNTQLFTSTSGLHSTTTDPGRVVFTSSGVWLLTGQVQWNGNSTSGLRMVRLLIDGSSVVAASRQRANAAGTDVVEQSISAIYRVASSGSYVELEVFQTSGSTCSVMAQDASPTLSAVKLR